MPPTSKFERRNYGGPKPNTTTRLPESIISEIEKESCAQHPDAGHSNLKKRPKNILTNRKQARKQARLEKKQRKNHHYQRQSHGDDQHHKQQVDPTDGDINASLKSFPERSAAKKRKRQDTQDARPIKRGSETTASNDNEEAKLARMAKKNPELYRRLRASNLVGSVQADGDNAAEDVEDMEMRRLEKKLGIKSSQNVTKKFGDDGLDFLLEGITMVGSKALRGEAAEKSRQAVGFSGNEVDTDDESAASDDIEEEDESMSSDNGSESFDEELDQNRSEVEAEGDDDDDSNDEMGSDPGDRLHGQDINTNHHQLSSALPKPLPNAQRSEETMSTTPAISGSKYIPPSLRAKLLAQKSEGSAKESAERQQRLLKIHRQVQGQINRLSESNMEVILGEIEAIYMDNPRAEVTSALSKVLIQSIRSRVHMLDTFLYINAAFVCAIYRLIGLEVAATLVQDLMEQLESAFNEGHALYKAQEGDAPSTRSTIDNSDSTDRMQGVDSQGGVGKECANLVAFLSELYNFRVITCQLVYDVMGLCAKEINEFTAELMLKIIQVSGINLRKDDPLALKKLINDVSETLSNSNGGSKPERSPSIRCKFMVETLTNLKNNRMKRTMNTSADNVSRLMKFIGNLSKKRAVVASEPINIGLKDIHDIETKGKWWLVGASWAGHEKLEDNERAKKPIVNKDSKSAAETLVKLAKKHHMNTDIRKSIFVTIMSSEDYIDAFERLMRLGLKEVQQREIIRVLIHCCGQEKVYNPFYTLIAHKLCAYDYSFRITLQYALWDFMRELGEFDVGGLGRISAKVDEDDLTAGSRKKVPLRRIANLARLYSWLIAKASLSLTVLKTVTFPKLQEQGRLFLQLLFCHLFLTFRQQTKENVMAVHEVFGKTTPIPTLTKGILFFLHHFVRHGSESLVVDENDRLVVKWGCRVAKEVLQSQSTAEAF